MDTRGKILEKARELFNEKGVEIISIREIAREVGISHGNLRYHFPGKEHIVEALFQACLEESDKAIQALLIGNMDMEVLVKVNRVQAEKFWNYRFLMNNLLEISRAYPKVGEALKEMFRNREEEFVQILALLQERGFLKPEPLPGYYGQLIHTFMIIVDFGIPYLELYQPDQKSDPVARYFNLWFQPLIPCLTDKGLEELEKYLGGEKVEIRG